MKIIVVIFALVHYIQGAIVVPGKCPQINAMDNFKIEQFIGIWHALEAFPNDYSEGLHCVYDNKMSYENNVLSGVFTGYKHTINKEVNMPYDLKFTEDDNVAQFNCNIQLNGNNREFPASILDTDYDNYAIYYSGKEDSTNCHQMAFIMSKNKSLSVEIRKKIQDFLIKHNLDTSHLRKINHDKC